MSDKITIAGHEFSVPDRYTEGHALNANEAHALNRAFHEGIRNSVAWKIRKDLPAGQSEPHWTDDLAAEWQSKVDAFATTFEFGVRTRTRQVMDLETKYAVEEASNAIVNAMRSVNKAAPKGKDLRDLALRALDGPRGAMYRTTARMRLRKEREEASYIIKDLGLTDGLTPAPANEAA